MRTKLNQVLIWVFFLVDPVPIAQAAPNKIDFKTLQKRNEFQTYLKENIEDNDYVLVNKPNKECIRPNENNFAESNNTF